MRDFEKELKFLLFIFNSIVLFCLLKFILGLRRSHIIWNKMRELYPCTISFVQTIFDFLMASQTHMGGINLKIYV